MKQGLQMIPWISRQDLHEISQAIHQVPANASLSKVLTRDQSSSQWIWDKYAKMLLVQDPDYDCREALPQQFTPVVMEEAEPGKSWFIANM